MSLDRLADLVGGGALAGTVIGRDGEIVRSANSQTVHGRSCDGAYRNRSCIQSRSFADVDFIAAEGAGDRVPREGCRGSRPAASTTRRRDNQRHRDCLRVPGALLDCDGCSVGPSYAPADIDSNRDGRTRGHRLAGG